mgnify:CR=1 FL=1
MIDNKILWIGGIIVLVVVLINIQNKADKEFDTTKSCMHTIEDVETFCEGDKAWFCDVDSRWKSSECFYGCGKTPEVSWEFGCLSPK